MKYDAYLPHEAIIGEKIIESPEIFTLRLYFADKKQHRAFSFQPGQFNMIYLPGGGEVPISIVSDPEDDHMYDHTIRAVGRITKGLTKLKAGDRVGIRGPFGNGWRMDYAKDKDVIVITGGIGCAPSVSIITYILRRRQQYGALKILQGVKHTDDFFYREKFADWRAADDTEVLLSANVVNDQHQPWYQGYVTQLIKKIVIDSNNTVVKMCGPELMMIKAIEELTKRGIRESDIFLTMERSMHCAIGHCGHCQFGPLFICKEGPVFRYDTVKPLFQHKGL